MLRGENSEQGSKIGYFSQPNVSYYDKELFKTMVLASCRLPGMYSIINFGRKELKQTGSGHFSCIGGFHSHSQKILVLDTARFKYPPYWVDIDQLYNSVNSIDNNSGKKRGILVLSKDQNTIGDWLAAGSSGNFQSEMNNNIDHCNFD